MDKMHDVEQGCKKVRLDDYGAIMGFVDQLKSILINNQSSLSEADFEPSIQMFESRLQQLKALCMNTGGKETHTTDLLDLESQTQQTQ